MLPLIKTKTIALAVVGSLALLCTIAAGNTSVIDTSKFYSSLSPTLETTSPVSESLSNYTTNSIMSSSDSSPSIFGSTVLPTSTFDSSSRTPNVSVNDTSTFYSSQSPALETTRTLLPTSAFDSSSRIPHVSANDTSTFYSSLSPALETTRTLLPTSAFDSSSRIPDVSVNDASMFYSTLSLALDTTSPVSESMSEYTITASVQTSSAPTSSTSGGIKPSSTAQALPQKPASKGLSTGGKAAIGILIPLAIIGLIILGVIFYRRYNIGHVNFKDFLQASVRYRTYTNDTYSDDEVTLSGNWRKLSES